MTAGKIDEPDLGRQLFEPLERETDSVTVESLLEALQRNGGTESLSVLTRYVEGEAKQYRESAFKALRRLKSRKAFPYFVGFSTMSPEQFVSRRSNNWRR